jgi:DNA-binding transcriptional MerR regulator
MTATATPQRAPARQQKLETIGAVCRRLKTEFPDISISKIRYLEDQGLVHPQRTPGGYRLFGEDDVDRLETILRLQRDEFLPLRVIRQELSTQVAEQRRRRRAPSLSDDEPDELSFAELCARADISPALARDLEEYGLIAGTVRGGDRYYRESDAEIAFACGRLASFGIDARHLRMFRTTADRAAGLLDQVIAPALRSRNPERHRAALENLLELGGISQELTQLLFWRALRRVAAAG